MATSTTPRAPAAHAWPPLRLIHGTRAGDAVPTTRRRICPTPARRLTSIPPALTAGEVIGTMQMMVDMPIAGGLRRGDVLVMHATGDPTHTGDGSVTVVRTLPLDYAAALRLEEAGLAELVPPPPPPIGGGTPLRIGRRA
ncbi:MAG TPA: hypothetical protein VGD56_19180 [Gemmatirosa sp.]